MMKRRICLLALPLLSIAACLDMSDQDSADGTSSQAVTTDNICETFGSFCVGAPIIDFEEPVQETGSGRTLQILPVAGVSGKFNLAFNADPTKCVAVKDSSTLVEVRLCTQTSAIWIPELGPNGSSCLFLNELGGFLSGHNDGSQFNVEDRGASGWNQQFIVPNPGPDLGPICGG